MSMTGDKELAKNLQNLSRMDLRQAVQNGIQMVRNTAVLLCPVDTGELRQSIQTDVSERGGIITGICYTNKAYAMYVEFGTGPKGQQNHEGISPDVNAAYTQSPWWIHESMVDRRVAEKYHWFHIDTKAGRFYQCTGQAAQPFMYPALKNNKHRLMEGIRSDFIASVERIIK